VLNITYPRHRDILSASISKPIFQEIEKIRAANKYANRSLIVEEILRDGLAARGIIIEA